MRSITLGAWFTAAALIAAVPAAAQDATLTPAAADSQSGYGGRRPVSSHSKIGADVYGTVDFESLLASRSYKAVLGSSEVTLFGGGVDVFGLWKGLFIRVDASRASKSGSRAFVDSTQTAVSLNIPITISFTPVDASVGWRFAGPKHNKHNITPFVGGGAAFMSYKETSRFAESGDNVSEIDTGFNVFGGVDVPVHKRITVGVEGQYRSFPNSLGTSGVSQAYNEKDLGGASLRVSFGVSLSKK